MTWLQQHPQGFRLRLHIQPGAARTEVSGLHGAALKIRLAAPPVDGKANARLIDFLADFFAVPKRQVLLLGGASSREKSVAIIGSTIPAERLLGD